MSDVPEPTPLAGYPALAFRFLVQFIRPGKPSNDLDMFFQSVSGIEATFTTDIISQTPSDQQGLPKGVRYTNLVLKRGLMKSSPLSNEIHDVIAGFRFEPCNVLVILYDQLRKPIASWTFMEAYPVRWSLSGFDAEQNGVVIETIEFTYQRMNKG